MSSDDRVSFEEACDQAYRNGLMAAYRGLADHFGAMAEASENGWLGPLVSAGRTRAETLKAAADECRTRLAEVEGKS